MREITGESMSMGKGRGQGKADSLLLSREPDTGLNPSHEASEPPRHPFL